MKCPLLLISSPGLGRREDTTASDCLKEECDWFSKELQQCDPTGLLPWFITLVSTLEDIVDKMPHEEQFRK